MRHGPMPLRTTDRRDADGRPAVRRRTCSRTRASAGSAASRCRSRLTCNSTRAYRADRELVLDLICHELLLRERRGESPDPDEYLRRFPEFAEDLRTQFEVRRALRGRQLRTVPTVLDAVPQPFVSRVPPLSRGRLRGAERTGPRRHGRRLPGAARRAEAAGRPQDDPVAGPRLSRAAGPFPRRGRGAGPPPASEHCSDLSKSANTRAGRFSPWNTCRAAAWTAA